MCIFTISSNTITSYAFDELQFLHKRCQTPRDHFSNVRSCNLHGTRTNICRVESRLRHYLSLVNGEPSLAKNGVQLRARTRKRQKVHHLGSSERQTERKGERERVTLSVWLIVSFSGFEPVRGFFFFFFFFFF